jgi:hypothetical protein
VLPYSHRQTCADGQAVRLWDPLTGRSLGLPIGAPNVNQIAFGLHGHLLAGSGNGLLRLWRMFLFADPYSALCAGLGPPTQREWNQYARGEAQLAVCD